MSSSELPDDPLNVDDFLSEITQALRRGSAAVGNALAEREAIGASADEEYLTNLLLDACHPDIRWVDFNRQQEGRLGADWLWWFRDPDGTAFGMLVQAKKLRGAPGNWVIDLAYPDGTKEQLTRLLRTADDLQVPAVHSFYFGMRDRRPDVVCEDCAEDCWRCQQMTVGILATLVARQWLLINSHSPGHLPIDLYRASDPLEVLGTGDRMPLVDLNLGNASADLRSLLSEQPAGVRAIAKQILRAVSEMRSGQEGAIAADQLTSSTTGEPLFDHYPADTGHFGVPYLEHVLRGLRRSAPAYVAAALDPGSDTPEELADVDGLVLIELTASEDL